VNENVCVLPYLYSLNVELVRFVEVATATTDVTIGITRRLYPICSCNNARLSVRLHCNNGKDNENDNDNDNDNCGPQSLKLDVMKLNSGSD